MKGLRVYISVILLFLAAFSEAVSAADNYISPATVPPSIRREGLVRSPDQLYNSGNLLITGNVRGGAYFRGVVPYRSPTDLAITLPSSSLDSFLRDSAGTEDIGRYSNYNLGYRPYYSPTETVVTALPDTSVTAGIPTTNISGYSLQSYINGTLPVRRDETLDPSSAISLARLRPMSMTPGEMQKLISSEIANYSPARLTDQQYKPQAEQPQAEQPQYGIGQESYEITKSEPTATGLNEPLLYHALKKPDSNLPALPGEKETKMPPDIPEELDLNKQLDVYDSMKHQIDSLQKKIEQALADERTGKARPDETSADDLAAGNATGEDSEKPAWQQQSWQRPKTYKFADINSTADLPKVNLGPYETFASYSEDKFNQYMRAGEIFLKHGKFYRSADAYTLASLYKPDDPLAYAGKSHALFASGEYMSSALFLTRCLQMFPEYARFKIDLVAMTGNRDMLESRVVDLEECFKQSNEPELQFLLAYVYYQMGRLQPAKEAIDAAYEKIPNGPAVLTLKKAIEDITSEDNNSSQRITDGAVPNLSW